MDLATLIDALSDPAAYPHAVEKVVVCQTHISVVFLAGLCAYKIKKPVNLTFLDFRTLERRRHFCEEEVRLNRRLAPHVYTGVVPIVRIQPHPPSPLSGSEMGATGGEVIHVEGAGEIVEWAVKMERLPEQATLQKRLLRGEIEPANLGALARRIAAFHAEAEANERIASFGRFEVVARNARENFEQARLQVGVTVSPAVFDRLRTLTEESLSRLEPLIEARAARGVPRDTHGDLHLDHVYLFPERTPPGDLVIVDCIEFNERFRFADPVADMAFLYMDLLFHGRSDLGKVFADAYLRAANDGDGTALLPFYTAYRAVVRAKVEGFKLAEPEIPEAERSKAMKKARALWLLALGQLEAPARRPCLVLIGGLPGAGKSTLARQLAELGEHAGFSVIRSDTVRKELAGAACRVSGQAAFEQGIYSPDWTERTYAECLRRAERLLWEGRRVIVDATFREERQRQAFLQAAARLQVPCLLFVCQADREVIRQRLQHRRDDASDAGWAVYQQVARRWERPGPAWAARWREIRTDTGEGQSLLQALQVLRDLELFP